MKLVFTRDVEVSSTCWSQDHVFGLSLGLTSGGGGVGSSSSRYYLGGIIALLLQDHRTMSIKSVCSSQYMVTDQH